ncbi:target of rapamycin [Actinidia rufa]|uniref:Target of rapamycin n=1 Tax=Actinidia rufa TaxID=165716 RepID=A0A7J0H188_9ERIC|nr:target of rapamycin [Actinidia rufa]
MLDGWKVQVWQALLAVRALVLPPIEDVETWLKFASLCRKSGRISQARSTLVQLLQFDPETCPENMRYHGPPQVILAYLKYQWSLGEDHKRREAFARLQDLAMELSISPNIQQVSPTGLMGVSNGPLLARVYLKLGTWQWALSPGLDDDSVKEILNTFRNATHCASKWAKAWHTWALFNTAVMSQYTVRGFSAADKFVVAAVTGYFHSIACAANAKGVDDSLQSRLTEEWNFRRRSRGGRSQVWRNGSGRTVERRRLGVLPRCVILLTIVSEKVRRKRLGEQSRSLGDERDESRERETISEIGIVTWVGMSGLQFAAVANPVVMRNVLGRVPFLSLEEAYAFVQQEESRRCATLQTPPSDRSALIATPQRGKLQTGTSNGANDRESLRCDYCQNTGHTRNFCWKLHRRPPCGEGVDVVVVVEVPCVLRLKPMFQSLQLLLLRLVLGSYLSRLVVFLKGRGKLSGI